MAPIVGQQVTLGRSSGQDAHGRLDLLLARAGSSPAECEVVATTRIAGFERGFLFLAEQGYFVSDRNHGGAISDNALRFYAFLRPVTYTCVPVGSGQRIALDADLDGCYDFSERFLWTDPRDPESVRASCS